MEVKLMWQTSDPEFQIIRAARICYGSEDKIDSRWEPTEQAQNLMMGGGMQLDVPLLKVNIGPNDEKLLRKIMTNNHNMCLRFASAAFHIVDVSRVCSHQLVRLAHFGILQRSQRYCNEENHGFMLPFDEDNPINDKMQHFCERAQELYTEAISFGVSEEDARYILPSAALTELNMVSNLQGWKHFLKIRLNKKVQLETKMVAASICRHLYKIAPIVFATDYDKLDKINL